MYDGCCQFVDVTDVMYVTLPKEQDALLKYYSTCQRYVQVSVVTCVIYVHLVNLGTVIGTWILDG